MKKIALAAMAAIVAVPTALPAPAMARHHYYNDNRSYHGRDGDYRYHCKRSNGTTGTIAGAVGGGVLGNVLGGGTIGTLAGAGGGALLGRHIDKRRSAAHNRREGC